MIGSLRGRVLEISGVALLLEVGGVGFRVLTSPSVLTRFHVGEEAFLYIHDHVREDARVLYGFADRDGLELFERLISISGVGPKVAMTVLAVGDPAVVRGAIMSGDLALLTSVPGVGKKTAQKIVLELKGQLVDASVESSGDREVVDALVSLGYSSADARDALKLVPTEVTETSERIREALKCLSR